MDLTKQEKFSPLKESGAVLKNKKIAIVGVGGLGSHTAEYVTRMGIGSIVLIDDDIVEASNLARQGTYTHQDSVEQAYKAHVLAEQLVKINPSLVVEAHVVRLTEQNCATLLEGVNLVLDGTDNFTSRYIVNDFCFAHQIPWIYAACIASVGTVINFIPGKTPCFRCVFGELNDTQHSCDTTGVILPALTMITSIQVTEAMKILLDKDPSLEEIRFNSWTREETNVPIEIFRNEECVCTTKQFQKKPPTFYMICGGDSIQVNTSYTLEEMEQKFTEWGYGIKKNNGKIVETVSNGKKRIVGYSSGKIIFYHMDKQHIQQQFEGAV